MWPEKGKEKKCNFQKAFTHKLEGMEWSEGKGKGGGQFMSIFLCFYFVHGYENIWKHSRAHLDAQGGWVWASERVNGDFLLNPSLRPGPIVYHFQINASKIKYFLFVLAHISFFPESFFLFKFNGEIYLAEGKRNVLGLQWEFFIYFRRVAQIRRINGRWRSLTAHLTQPGISFWRIWCEALSFNNRFVDYRLHLTDALDLKKSEDSCRLFDVFILLIHTLAIEDWEWISFENRLLEGFLVEVVFDDAAHCRQDLQRVWVMRNLKFVGQCSHTSFKLWTADCENVLKLVTIHKTDSWKLTIQIVEGIYRLHAWSARFIFLSFRYLLSSHCPIFVNWNLTLWWWHESYRGINWVLPLSKYSSLIAYAMIHLSWSNFEVSSFGQLRAFLYFSKTCGHSELLILRNSARSSIL